MKPQNKHRIFGLIMILILVAGSIIWIKTINDTTLPDISNKKYTEFNFVLKYGPYARNEINTFNHTFTQDMVTALPLTINLTFTPEELETIYEKMKEINFFEYPEEIFTPSPFNNSGVIPPSIIDFTVSVNSTIKRLYCGDHTYYATEDEQAKKLNVLLLFIFDILESNEDYQNMPEPIGGYD
ncbi:MAG: hypothetical protein V1726_01935 [Methanobacteriota archaeon]